MDNVCLCVQKLLGVETEEVISCLTSMVTVTRGEYVKRTYTRHQAEGEYIDHTTRDV